MKARKHFYLDENALANLEAIARSERLTVSDLVREGVDRVIADRQGRSSDPSDEALRRGFAAFFEKWRATGEERSDAEIDDLITREMRPHKHSIS